MSTAPAASDALAQLCLDLRTLRDQAGGPSVRVLGDEVGLGKSQVDAILNGRIRRPPDWQVVRVLVEVFYKYAHDHGRNTRLSIQAGVDEYWRPRYSLVEHAFTHAVDVRKEAEPTAAVGVQPIVPRQLPPIGPHFAGRTGELASLSAAPGPLLITGMAGVGKTTLAVAWAHQAAHRFPDGQLYVNLRGFDPTGQAMTAEQALRGFLEALGVNPRTLPQGFEAQVGLYRSLIAGRAMLLVLDNARDATQVRPLLPGTPTAQAVITSRMELPGLVVAEGAYPLRLDVLSDAEARQLLVGRIGAQRLDAEPEAVEELLAICGRLPIALAIVAARARIRPGFPLSAIAEDTRGTLRGWELGDAGTDLRDLFSWSYRELGTDAARLFRLLGLHIGSHIGADAAASLFGAPVRKVRPLLGELTRAHLITEPEPGRYGFHDLLRAYALQSAYAAENEAQREAAQRRILDHYVQSAYAAALAISPHRVPVDVGEAAAGVTPQRFTDRDEGLRWFGVECDVLLAMANHAGLAGYDGQAWRLGWSLADYLEIRGRFTDWIDVQRTAVASIRRVGDRNLLARNLIILGNASLLGGDVESAYLALFEALEIFRTLGEPRWQARCEHTLGAAYERVGRYADALDRAKRALELYRLAGDREGVARSHNGIGWCLSCLGDYDQAIVHCEQALLGYQELGEPAGQAATLDSLGSAHQSAHRYAEALRCFEQALALARTNDSRYNEARVLTHIGEAHRENGDEAAAREAWGQAVAILDGLDQPEAAAVRARMAA